MNKLKRYDEQKDSHRRVYSIWLNLFEVQGNANEILVIEFGKWLPTGNVDWL